MRQWRFHAPSSGARSPAISSAAATATAFHRRSAEGRMRREHVYTNSVCRRACKKECVRQQTYKPNG